MGGGRWKKQRETGKTDLLTVQLGVWGLIKHKNIFIIVCLGVTLGNVSVLSLDSALRDQSRKDLEDYIGC